MRARLLVVATLLITACAKTDPEAMRGGLNLGVAVSALTASQNFCFTWKLFEEVKGTWTLSDQRVTPVCANNGVDSLSDYATCTDGRRFLVEYNVTFGGTATGTAVATSGGLETDLCLKNHDTATTAVVQYANQGNKGGINPGIEVDQVCWNDKLVIENGRVVSALWVQPDSCTGAVPDDFCAFGWETGTGLDTVRTGITADGLTRYIFSEAELSATFGVAYLAFDPGLAADTLYLFHDPWVLMHTYTGGALNRAVQDALATYRYNSAMGVIVDSTTSIVIGYTLAATCNGPLALPAVTSNTQMVSKPACSGGGLASFVGVIPTGGSTFQIVFDCGGSPSQFVTCDANGTTGGTFYICPPPV